ncbi:hypothetical protein CC78DRAFT_611521 [Lojkania enalia]|uniref:Uncharacterized protein n=1 Tax=Lojkania enalia TaxID=147567 RepID=A0A9P4TR62_9PLEO|nr:hypothetical protein CC78DRAFT_611521 [Didymosphaeria enalia]
MAILHYAISSSWNEFGIVPCAFLGPVGGTDDDWWGVSKSGAAFNFGEPPIAARNGTSRGPGNIRVDALERSLKCGSRSEERSTAVPLITKISFRLCRSDRWRSKACRLELENNAPGFSDARKVARMRDGLQGEPRTYVRGGSEDLVIRQDGVTKANGRKGKMSWEGVVEPFWKTGEVWAAVFGLAPRLFVQPHGVATHYFFWRRPLSHPTIGLCSTCLKCLHATVDIVLTQRGRANRAPDSVHSRHAFRALTRCVETAFLSQWVPTAPGQAMLIFRALGLAATNIEYSLRWHYIVSQRHPIIACTCPLVAGPVKDASLLMGSKKQGVLRNPIAVSATSHTSV